MVKHRYMYLWLKLSPKRNINAMRTKENSNPIYGDTEERQSRHIHAHTHAHPWKTTEMRSEGAVAAKRRRQTEEKEVERRWRMKRRRKINRKKMNKCWANHIFLFDILYYNYCARQFPGALSFLRFLILFSISVYLDSLAFLYLGWLVFNYFQCSFRVIFFWCVRALFFVANLTNLLLIYIHISSPIFKLSQMLTHGFEKEKHFFLFLFRCSCSTSTIAFNC